MFLDEGKGPQQYALSRLAQLFLQTRKSYICDISNETGTKNYSSYKNEEFKQCGENGEVIFISVLDKIPHKIQNFYHYTKIGLYK